MTYKPLTPVVDAAVHRGRMERVKLAGPGDATEETEWVPFELVVSGLAAGSGAATANTAAIQAALNFAETALGGVVTIPIGTWYINDTLAIGSRVILRGLGWGSILVLANGTSTDAAHKAMIMAKGNTNYVGLADLYLDGNSANQTGDTVNGAHGVDFYSRGSTEGMGGPVYDGGLWIRNVMAFNCKGIGFYCRGDATTMRVHNCYAYHNVSHGFQGKTDCIFTDSVAGNNTGNGFYFYAGTSIVCSGLKAFGNNVDFGLENSNTIMMSNCQSEDVSFAGWYISVCKHVSLMGCQVYRCKGSDSLRSGFWIQDDGAGGLCSHIMLRGCSVLGGGATGINYALFTRNLGPGCDFEIHTESLLVARWNRFSGVQDCRAVFGNGYLDAVQSIAYAATITPDQYLGGTVIVGALTGNLTVNAPAEPYVGQTLRFMFTQDATGTRTVTFNSVFKKAGGAFTASTGNGAKSDITFVYDGASWVETARTLALA